VCVCLNADTRAKRQRLEALCGPGARANAPADSQKVGASKGMRIVPCAGAENESFCKRQGVHRVLKCQAFTAQLRRVEAVRVDVGRFKRCLKLTLTQTVRDKG
jgi:hypothetical protein